MIVKYKLVNPKRNKSYPYDRVYKLCGVTGVYSDLRNDKWVIMCGGNRHCFSKQDVFLVSVEWERKNV